MYSFESTIRYSEIDRKEKLSVAGIVNYFQDCSSFQSEMLNIGVRELEKAHRAWVLSAWQIVINRRPLMLEEVKISTWPYEFESFYGKRNFILETKAGENLVSANSLWVHIDTQTGRPVKPEGDFYNAYIVEPRYDGMDYASRKIKFDKENMQPQETFRVKQSNLDTNNHVNNGQYIQMAQEYLPKEYRIKQIRAEYKVSARYGDIICPYIYKEQDNKYIVDLRNEAGRTFAVIEFASDIG